MTCTPVPTSPSDCQPAKPLDWTSQNLKKVSKEKRPEEAQAWGGSGVMLSKRANWAMPLHGAECFQLWDYTAHGWVAGKVCCLWTPFGIKPKCLNTKGKTIQCGWCHRASWGKQQKDKASCCLDRSLCLKPRDIRTRPRAMDAVIARVMEC